MWFPRSLVFVIFMVSSFSTWELSNAGPPMSKMITVSPRGDGDFKTITEAIEKGVPVNSKKWVKISVKPGIYTEKVTVPPEKPFIIMEGSSKETTTVNWNGNSNFGNPTLLVKASSFVARRITFENTYNHAKVANGIERKPALAVSVEGDKSFFYDCGFIGVQDTLLDSSGRHYFKDCYIEGAVDFIFGRGQSIYQGCNINVTAGITKAIPGYITAQKRESSDESTGFVFKYCNIFGTGPVYLGRAYGPCSRVIYYGCTLSNIVAPEGWDAWNYKGNEGCISYVEANNTGPGSDISKRVRWINKLNYYQVEKLVSISFINADHWLERIPA